MKYMDYIGWHYFRNVESQQTSSPVISSLVVIQLGVFFYLLLCKAGNFVVEKPFSLLLLWVQQLVCTQDHCTGCGYMELEWLHEGMPSAVPWCPVCVWTLWAEHYLTCPRPRSRMVYDGPIISWPMTRPEFRLDSHHHLPGSGGRWAGAARDVMVST